MFCGFDPAESESGWALGELRKIYLAGDDLADLHMKILGQAKKAAKDKQKHEGRRSRLHKSRLDSHFVPPHRLNPRFVDARCSDSAVVLGIPDRSCTPYFGPDPDAPEAFPANDSGRIRLGHSVDSGTAGERLRGPSIRISASGRFVGYPAALRAVIGCEVPQPDFVEAIEVVTDGDQYYVECSHDRVVTTVGGQTITKRRTIAGAASNQRTWPQPARSAVGRSSRATRPGRK